MHYSFVLGLAGLAMGAPIADNYVAMEDLTTSLVFNTTLDEFNTWRNAGIGPVELMLDTEGCPMGPGQHGQRFQDACRRREFALKNYNKQERLTKDNKKQINHLFKLDLMGLCPEAIFGLPCSEMAKIYYQTIKAYGKDRATKFLDLHFIEPKTPCDRVKQAYQNGNTTLAILDELDLCGLQEVYQDHPVPESPDSVTNERRGGGVKCLGGKWPGGPGPQRRGDMTGSDSDYEPCNTSWGSDESREDWDIWEVEALPMLEKEPKDNHLNLPSENGNSAAKTKDQVIHRRMADPQCQVDLKRRGDMTGSDSDFEPCGTSINSVESGMIWSTWEVESVPTHVQRRRRAVEVLRNLLAESTRTSNPHSPAQREALLKKYCGTLQYDIEVGGIKDDGTHNNLEEKVMMSTCRMFGYYNVHDGQVNHHSEVSEAGMTTDEEACPGIEDCKGLVGTEYQTSESDEDNRSSEKRDRHSEGMRKYYENRLFNTTLQDFMDAQNEADSSDKPDRLAKKIYKGCANLTASPDGWNFHDACIRREYGYWVAVFMVSETEELRHKAEARIKFRIDDLFKQDLHDECLSHFYGADNKQTQIKCLNSALMYYTAVDQFNTEAAAHVFDKPDKVILKDLAADEDEIDWS